MCKQDYVFRGLGVTLSGRGRIPEAESPDRHPLIIAIHGGTYSSRYFDVAGYSLLDRAQAQQLPIFAIDRPGYGLSADYAANAPSIMDNAEILDSAIHGLWHSYSHKACGIVLVGHSIGGAITIAIAARQPSWPLLGIAISGVGLDPVPASPPNALVTAAALTASQGSAGSSAAAVVPVVAAVVGVGDPEDPPSSALSPVDPHAVPAARRSAAISGRPPTLPMLWGIAATPTTTTVRPRWRGRLADLSIVRSTKSSRSIAGCGSRGSTWRSA